MRILLAALGLAGLLLAALPLPARSLGTESERLPSWAIVPAQPTDEEAPTASPEQLAPLAAILARPEFRVSEGRTLFDRLLDPLRSWLRWLVGEIARALVRGIQAGGDAVPVGLAVVALAVVGVAGFVVRRLLRGTVTGSAEIAGGRQGGPPRAADERDRARALAAAGAYRQAIHHLHRAVLLRLDERDHLDYADYLTNRELLPRLNAAPELARPFGELVSRFDRLWYGQADCSAEEHAAFAALAEGVWRAADTVPPAHREPRGLTAPGVASSAPASVSPQTGTAP